MHRHWHRHPIGNNVYVRIIIKGDRFNSQYFVFISILPSIITLMIDFSNQQISIPNFGYLFLRMPETCCNPVKLAILSDLDTLIIVIDTRFKGKETNVDAVDPFPVRLFFVSFRFVLFSSLQTFSCIFYFRYFSVSIWCTIVFCCANHVHFEICSI